MKSLSILALIAIFFGCDSTKKIIETETIETIDTGKPERNVMIKAGIGEFTDSEQVTIKNVRLEGNTLFIDITIIAGCGVHNFKLTGSPAIMKSNPPKRSVKIIHEVPREECSDSVNKILEVDISALATSQTSGSTIYLLLDGWDEEIKYVFE